jgi:hypothetical protein
MLRAPDVPSDGKGIYTGKQFNDLLVAAQLFAGQIPFAVIALTGFCWMRTSELVRLYSSEDVLEWEDIDLDNERIHVRETVGKSTRRRSGNERFPPLSHYVTNWLSLAGLSELTGRIVPVLHAEFADKMRALHKAAGVPQINNGLRRSAIQSLSGGLSRDGHWPTGSLGRNERGDDQAPLSRDFDAGSRPYLVQDWREH